MKRRKEDIGYIPKPLMTLQTKVRLERELQVAEEEAKDAEQAIGSAGGTDDWHENFALEQAYQDFDRRIKKSLRLRSLLSNVEIIKPRQEVGEIGLGNTIIVQYGDDDSEKFTVLGEADIGTQRGWISFASPSTANFPSSVVPPTVTLSVVFVK